MLTLLMIAVLHCGSGRRYPAFLRLSYTDRQLSATNEPHLFSRQRLFLDTDSKSNFAVFSLFYRIFPDLSSVFLIFPHFFLSGRIFSGNRGKPYTFFVQTVKIRTECLILSKQGAILKHRYIFLYPCPEGVCHVYQSYFSNRRTFISAHRTVSPSHWLRGMWHGCKQIGISGLTKQTRDILFYLELLFQNASGAFAAEGFFYKPLPANGGFGKGQQTNLTRRNQKGGNYEIKRCTNCH